MSLAEYLNSAEPRQGHICQQEYPDGVVWDPAAERQDFLSLVSGYKIHKYPLIYVYPWSVICKWKFEELNHFYNCLMLWNCNSASLRKQFGNKANHSCFLVFYILHLSRKWPTECGIWTREGNWTECGRKRLENRAPHSSSVMLALAKVPRLPCDNGTCSSPAKISEAAWKLKSSVPKSGLRSAIVWSWTKHISALGSP